MSGYSIDKKEVELKEPKQRFLAKITAPRIKILKNDITAYKSRYCVYSTEPGLCLPTLIKISFHLTNIQFMVLKPKRATSSLRNFLCAFLTAGFDLRVREIDL